MIVEYATLNQYATLDTPKKGMKEEHIRTYLLLLINHVHVLNTHILSYTSEWNNYLLRYLLDLDSSQA